jgi:GNAT superfamily N-acetyltransferase
MRLPMPLPAERIERIDAHGRLTPIADPRAALLEGEAVHRELRPALQADYAGWMDVMFEEGARLIQLADADGVRGVAVWRMFHTTYAGLRMEVDDLVTAEAARSSGYGAVLLDFIEAKARALGCQSLTLNSAVHRERAHRFYFRQRFAIFAFHFSKAL